MAEEAYGIMEYIITGEKDRLITTQNIQNIFLGKRQSFEVPYNTSRGVDKSLFRVSDEAGWDKDGVVYKLA